MRHTTYCRICAATCGLLVDVEDGRVTKVSGDPDNPLSRGFTCPKGRRIGDFHSDPERLRTSQRKVAPGEFEPVTAGEAVDQIAVRLRGIVETHGPESVGMFLGTAAATTTLTRPFAIAWLNTLGSHKRFSTMTIDQSAKWVADSRLGTWAAGRQRFADADVWLLAGTNPLISMQGGDLTGFPIHDGLRRLQYEQRRGLRLIVVDPRRTEVAARADIHLQLVPGTDPFLFAGMLHVILSEGLVDTAFCDRWVSGLDALRRAGSPCTPELVAARCGVPAGDVVAAARMFANGTRGMATTGTGPDMGPWSNLSEHLVRSLNVVCGRFPREGDRQAGGGVLGSGRALPAHAVSPDRSWESGYHSRFGYGLLKGELPTASLPAEILEPGADRLRALVVVGANPAAAIPNQDEAIRALSSLDLLVTIDPYLTETARLADYVVAPVMHLERPDTTRAYERLFDEPFAQHTPALLERPGDVIDDWELFLRLAWAMGSTLTVAGREYAPPRVPTAGELLERYAARSRVSLDEVKAYPHGAVFDDVAPTIVGPPAEDAAGRFEVLPDDVAAELRQLLQSTDDGSERPFRLVVRRAKETINTFGRRLPNLSRRPFNPCFVHPDDLAALAVSPGTLMMIASDHGAIRAVVEADASMRPGVVSMTHGYGGFPGEDDDPLRYGANPTRLLDLASGAQSINAMPVMTAVAVTISPVTGPSTPEAMW